MLEAERDSWAWRLAYGVALALVIAAFLFSLRAILNPFLLFVLLVFLLSPYAGSRTHLLAVVSAGMLTLIWGLQTTGSLLAPFFLALVFAYVFHPLVRSLERGRVGRVTAILLLMLPLVAVLVVAVLVGIPALSRQIARLVATFPDLVQAAAAWLERAQASLLRADLPFVDETELITRVRGIQPEAVVEFVQARQAEIGRRVWEGVLGAGRGLGALLTILGYVFLTPILTFYLLRDWELVLAKLGSLLPRPRRDRVLGFAREYDRLLSRYLRGQLIAAASVGVSTGLGFWLLGFPNALLLGVVAGVFNVVPYLGLVVSLIPALVIALFSGAVLASLGKIALVFGVVQFLDSSVIGPRIVGESVGLHPVWVILALAVSGFFFGFVGLLIAIPLAVLVKLLLGIAVVRYERSAFFHGRVP